MAARDQRIGLTQTRERRGKGWLGLAELSEEAQDDAFDPAELERRVEGLRKD